MINHSIKVGLLPNNPSHSLLKWWLCPWTVSARRLTPDLSQHLGQQYWLEIDQTYMFWWWRKLEHANTGRTCKFPAERSCTGWESSPEPSSYEATALTTDPPRHYILITTDRLAAHLMLSFNVFIHLVSLTDWLMKYVMRLQLLQIVHFTTLKHTEYHLY